MKHLLVTYAWSINNIGDMGIQAGLMTLLRQICPEVPVKLMSYLPREDDAWTYYRDALPPYNPQCQVLPMPFFDFIAGDPLPDAASEATRNLQVKGRAWGNLVQRHSRVRLEQFRNGTLPARQAEAICEYLLERFPLEVFADMQELMPEAAEAFSNAAFVYYNSGTTLNFGRLGVRRLFGYTLPLAMSLLLARALKIPYGIGSQSFDQIEWPVELLYRKMFWDAEFVYCRDTDSMDYLRQKKFEFRKFAFRPDTTVSFHRSDDAWADEYLRAHGLTEQPFLTMILRISSPKAKYHDPTGGAVSAERCAAQMQRIKVFLEQWLAETGGKVLLAHETRDTLGENNARDFLYDILSEEAQKNTVYLDFFWTPEQALGVFKRTALLASMEIHSLIMGIGNGIPVLHLPYAECGRKRQMFADVGLGELLVDIDDDDAAAQMSAIARRLAADPERTQGLLAAARDKVLTEVNRTLTEVAGYCRRA
ncbi:MAG: polysaccharide pyruvyl transferase family protein [Lentisphaerae bacterium]|nr:polysaccharide pyruvyl transferase family protein [Lentisphaerota bacterium]